MIIALLFLFIGAVRMDLQAKYPFSTVLLDEGGQYYEMHWNFSRSNETICFAVNVSTTGWVGLGLSPNGQMPRSDVVIGWVDSAGRAHFSDRYADGRYRPSIDESQDWNLTSSEERNGYTLMEFCRSFITCDPRDMDITSSTARIVWSFSFTDPVFASGSDARRHDHRGSTSINLLGGLPMHSDTLPHTSVDILVSNIEIPTDTTTYWCSTFQFPIDFTYLTYYITRYSPVITQHNRAYVHHMLVYICVQPLQSGEVGQSRPCSQLNSNISLCRRGKLIGAWAVGGEDFVYPDGIGYSIGGARRDIFALIEIRYDNPRGVGGVMDSSGMKFYYSTEVLTHDAGILLLGHEVHPLMLIPPWTSNFTVAGICSASCTNTHIPEEGIRIFANALHTHFVGRTLTLQHFRFNTECRVWEELEPIDQNLNYDFNFQQATHLPKEHLVLPGDVLVLLCEYDTSKVGNIVMGGESINEEMCLTFPAYYPKAADGSSLMSCGSFPYLETSFIGFVEYLLRTNPFTTLELSNAGTDINRVIGILNGLNWAGDPQLARTLQDSVLNSVVEGVCSTEAGQSMTRSTSVPQTNCSYKAADPCRGTPASTCCGITATTSKRLVTVEQTEEKTHSETEGETTGDTLRGTGKAEQPGSTGLVLFSVLLISELASELITQGFIYSLAM